MPRDMQADGVNVTVDDYPDKCPSCHHAVEPNFIKATKNGAIRTGAIVDAAFKCTRLSCQRLFISIYKRDHNYFKFQKSVPLKFQPPEIFDEVKTVSPDFENIFTQATHAESMDFDQIAGVGYRKALEFLIKDFCISKNPDKEDEIKSKFLGQVINEYVDDGNLKGCASRAVWLGNDETHYTRKWENKDIDDLKILIKLTCAWIQHHILTAEYIESMSRPNVPVAPAETPAD